MPTFFDEYVYDVMICVINWFGHRFRLSAIREKERIMNAYKLIYFFPTYEYILLLLRLHYLSSI